MGDHPLRPPSHRSPGGPLPRQLANGTHAHPLPPELYPPPHAGLRVHGVLIRLSAGYPPGVGRLHTRYAPVRRSPPVYCYTALPLDLHVLGLPLAFILSQDQTLHCIEDLLMLFVFSHPGFCALLSYIPIFKLFLTLAFLSIFSWYHRVKELAGLPPPYAVHRPPPASLKPFFHSPNPFGWERKGSNFFRSSYSTGKNF